MRGTFCRRHSCAENVLEPDSCIIKLSANNSEQQLKRRREGHVYLRIKNKNSFPKEKKKKKIAGLKHAGKNAPLGEARQQIKLRKTAKGNVNTEASIAAVIYGISTMDSVGGRVNLQSRISWKRYISKK